MGEKYRPKGNIGLRDLAPQAHQERGGFEKLDLHGARREDVRDRVDTFLDRFFSSGNTTVEIVHGDGTGAVKQELIKYLAELKLFNAKKNYHGLSIRDFRQKKSSVLVDLD